MLERGANLNKRSVTDLTPLCHAVKYAAPDLLRELLDRGGDVQKGETLQHALDRLTDVVTVLGMPPDKGAPLDAVMYANHSGSRRLYNFINRGTPLCEAALIGNVEAVRCWLERGADASIPNPRAGRPSSVLSGRDLRDCRDPLSSTEFPPHPPSAAAASASSQSPAQNPPPAARRSRAARSAPR